jgi:hypothetical protein
MTTATPSDTTSAATAPASPFGRGGIVGLVLLHFGVSAWIGYGAVAKTLDLNPMLLPPPILKSLTAVAQSLEGDQVAFLTNALRFIIGAEVFLAVAILLSARYARFLAVATLSLFCAILLYAMGETAMKDGPAAALTGSCGCFGEKGLPASVMFAVDAALLASALFLVPKGRKGPFLPLIPAAVLGVAVAVLAPSRTVTIDPNAVVIEDDEWPDAPAAYQPIYLPRWKELVGSQLRDQPWALAINRPMPEGLEVGEWIVTFSRPDCDRCQEFYRTHFASPRPERILKVSVPSSGGKPLPMPCEGCEVREFYTPPAGSDARAPEYMMQTPWALRLKDGVIVALCRDVDDPAQIAALFGAAAPAAEGPTTPANPTDGTPAENPPTPPAAQPTPPAPPTPPAQPEQARRWPGLPQSVEAMYLPDFPSMVGQRFDEIPFARLMTGRIPRDILSGRWIVIYYRENCEHCHILLGTYFTGKLPVRTLTVSIPDVEPEYDNPCDECVKLSLAKGPNYIVGSPIILAIKDGVVECVVENADDIPALEACLGFGSEGR